MHDRLASVQSVSRVSGSELRSPTGVGSVRLSVISACLFCLLLSLPSIAQQSDPGTPVVVQPGAPGEPSRILPSSTRAKLPPVARKDVEFMQGMIMHHAQAVEMTSLIGSRTDNKDILLLGARIGNSQIDEINFMKRWLEIRGEPVSMPPSGARSSHDHGKQPSGHEMLMPGMLSPKQMDELRKAKGAEFDRLFLAGMIQHHEGALVMVKDLFDTTGAGQDAELFSFATDVDNGQRVEIKSMQTLLKRIP
jgi:uncharacterized protein (DUF305 family)